MKSSRTFSCFTLTGAAAFVVVGTAPGCGSSSSSGQTGPDANPGSGSGASSSDSGSGSGNGSGSGSDRARAAERLLARSKSNNEIAALLSISLRTVQTHIANIFDKLGVHSRAGAAIWLVEHDLVR